MALINNQKSHFLDTQRNLAMEITSLRDKIRAATQKWNSLGLASGGANEFTQPDIDATQYAGLTVAEVTAIMTTFNSFETWIDGGHDDNLEKIMP